MSAGNRAWADAHCGVIPADERQPLGSAFAAAVASLVTRCNNDQCRVQTYKGDKCPACYGTASTA